MGINSDHLLNYIIVPALDLLDMDSPAARLLLLGTAAQESRCGHYIRQLDGGPALGIFQMEPATYWDIWDNYIRYRPEIKEKLSKRWPMQPLPGEMVTDLLLAAVMCRLHYRRKSSPLPPAADIRALASYWKQHYNTRLGKGTIAEFEDNFLAMRSRLGGLA
ncbi:MAG: hypothetical protein HQL67_10945 [Magnetococcales bacterium]|nr:hypothetical protein [Magnetococcales bacterium]